MKSKIINSFIIMGIICLLCAFVYYGWTLTRHLNYILSYEDKVIETTEKTVCRLIKTEYLIKPCDQ